MLQSFTLSFKKNISLIEDSKDHVVLQSPLITLNIPQITLNLKRLSPGLLTAIKILGSDGATEEYLCNLVVQTDGELGLRKFYYYLEQFINLGIVCHTVLLNGVPLITRVPISPIKQFHLTNIAPDKQYVLSRFAYCHRDTDEIVLESPLSHSQIILSEAEGATLFTELFRPKNCRELCLKVPGISEEIARMLFSLLLNSKFISELQENGQVQEDENDVLLQWEFHDLLFHSRSRTGRHDHPVGRTYRFLEKIQSLPALKPKVGIEIIPLHKPDIEVLKHNDFPFTFILEERKSIRSYNNIPLTDKQLGEFLYRSARIRNIIQTEREEISSRPYVNAGANYELELYVIVNVCNNIPSGLYHYCPQEHQLHKLSDINSHVAALLKEAQLSNRDWCIPQVLIVITARFQRVTWAYESIAYSGILKNVGALFQTMYLVATAMDLAACAIGSGNSDLFADATGTDYYTESSVGEFILGNKPAN